MRGVVAIPPMVRVEERMRREERAREGAFGLLTCDKESIFALERAISAGVRPRLLLSLLDRETGLAFSSTIPPELIEEQARLLEIPLLRLSTTRAEYYRDMQRLLFDLRTEGITRGIFGRVGPREEQEEIEGLLGEFDMRGLFPLRGVPPLHLIRRQIEGMRSVIVAIDREKISESYLGRDFDLEFVEYLEERGIDPTGEGGEFSTFVCRSNIMSGEIFLTHAERIATPERIGLDVDFWKVVRTKS